MGGVVFGVSLNVFILFGLKGSLFALSNITYTSSVSSLKYCEINW